MLNRGMKWRVLRTVSGQTIRDLSTQVGISWSVIAKLEREEEEVKNSSLNATMELYWSEYDQDPDVAWLYGVLTRREEAYGSDN